MRLPKRKYLSPLLPLAILLFGLVFSWFFRLIPVASAEDSEAKNSAVIGESHFVTVFADGERLIIRTTAETVEEVLDRLDIVRGPSDLIEPSLDTKIDANHFYINIYRAHPALLIVGDETKYFETASFDPKYIFTSAGITVYDGDEISEAKNSLALESGISYAYELKRNGGRLITVTEEIPFETETIRSASLPSGSSEVTELGVMGEKTLTYEVLYVDGVEASRTLVKEEITKAPKNRVVTVGVSLNVKPLTAAMGRNRYSYQKSDGTIVERQETYYDLNMSGTLRFCGATSYSVRSDGVKVDQDGYILVAANLDRYPRCSVVETSLGLGKVYDTGGFARTNPEQFDIATDWTNHNGQ